VCLGTIEINIILSLMIKLKWRIKLVLIMEKEWQYYPNVFKHILIQDIIDECENLWSGQRSYNGKQGVISRKSCVFTSDIKKTRNKLPGYNDIKFYTWDYSLIALKIKAEVEKLVNHSFDYVLLHFYTNGKATIGYHNDKESLNSEIASVSIGQKRKFRIRRLGQTRGWIEELHLGEGDLLIMNKGMQKRYDHGVPAELKIKDPRCNYTFRNFPE
jgi:alkylated DNA repair dioxygenase AlkB